MEKRGYGIKFDRTESNNENSMNNALLIGWKFKKNWRQTPGNFLFTFLSYHKAEKILLASYIL